MRFAPGLVERRLVEVADPRDVHLALLPQNDRGLMVHAVDDDRGVPYRVLVLGVTLEDAVDDDERVLGGQIEAQLRGAPFLGGLLGELAPPLLPRAERKGHRPALLGAEDLALAGGGDLGGLGDSKVERPALLLEGSVGGRRDRVLREREPHQPRRAQLLGLGAEAVAAEPEARGGGRRGRLRWQGQGLDGGSAVETEEDAPGFGEGLGGEVVLLRRRGGGEERERKKDDAQKRVEVE